jgi:hypothetical protein
MVRSVPAARDRCGAARWPPPSFLRSAGRLCPRSARGLGLIRNSLAGINAHLSHRSRHQPINICCAGLKVTRGGGDPAVESARLSRRLAGSARHLPSRPSSSTRHFPSRPASSARHFPSRPAGSTCGLARSCLSRRHGFFLLGPDQVVELSYRRLVMRDGGQGARISFPQALPLANRCCCGSDARFYCQRPDWLRVPKSKHRQTCLRVSCQRPE